jgi:hypothetical protein
MPSAVQTGFLTAFDVSVLFWISARRVEPWLQKRIAADFEVSTASVSQSVTRLRDANTLNDAEQARVPALLDVLPAMRWLYPTSGGHYRVRGMPTGHTTPGLDLGIVGDPMVSGPADPDPGRTAPSHRPRSR